MAFHCEEVVATALALLGGCSVFTYFHYFVEPKYLWDNGLNRDVRTIWAKNRKLVEKNEERDVTDLEFYFWIVVSHFCWKVMVGRIR